MTGGMRAPLAANFSMLQAMRSRTDALSWCWSLSSKYKSNLCPTIHTASTHTDGLLKLLTLCEDNSPGKRGNLHLAWSIPSATIKRKGAPEYWAKALWDACSNKLHVTWRFAKTWLRWA